VPIFDQGYQHWSGTLSGHGWRWLTIARHGVRGGMASRPVRACLLLSWVPALVLVFTLCVWGLLERKSELVAPLSALLTFLDPQMLAEPKRFRVEEWTICYDFFLLTELRFSMVLILLVGPRLISQDLRFNALPLYFSRPLRRIDYLAGKLGIIAAFLGLMIVVPAVIAYVLGLLFSLDWTILRDTFGLLVSSVAYGAVVAVSAGMLVLALSSLSRSSRYVVLFFLGLWIVGGVLGVVLEGVNHDQRRHAVFNKRLTNHPLHARSSTQPLTPAEQRRLQRDWQQTLNRAIEEARAEEVKAAATNWRPVVSYTANLSRVGQHLLGTNAQWESLAKLRPESQRARFLYDFMGPQYPWYWSGFVLVGLLGLSVCILNFRVKSLDRLR
jgi:ABC-type transport system involved in multi-copper enzyme maturation permease subunit